MVVKRLIRIGPVRRAVTWSVAITLAIPVVIIAPGVSSAAGCAPPTFAARTALTGASDTEDVIAVDVDGDGDRDLVAPNFLSSVSTFINNGSGSFAAPISSPSGGSTGVNYEVRAGDFDEDGKIDLVVAQPYDNAVGLLRGDGTGHFAVAATVPAGAFPTGLAVGDLDADGNLDVAVRSLTGNSAGVLFGNGAGAFAGLVGITLNAGAAPADLALGDMDGDGGLDIVVANLSGDSITRVLNKGARTFGELRTKTVRDAPDTIALGDLDRDGNLDVVVGHISDNRVSVVLGKGADTFQPFGTVMEVDKGSPTAELALGDVDGDGDLDAVATGLSVVTLILPPNVVRVLANDGTGNLTVATTIDVPAVDEQPNDVVVAQLDTDGALDIATADNFDATVSVFRNTCTLPTTDLRATDIEVTQVVQDLANSVPLVAMKRTVARVRVVGNRTVAGMTARLSRVDASGNLVGRPLWPSNPASEIDVVAAPNRGLVNDSFWFELPADWLQGTLSLRAEVDPLGSVAETDESNNAVLRTVSFVTSKSLPIVFVKYRYQECKPADTDYALLSCKDGAPTQLSKEPSTDSIPAMVSALRRAMPTAKVTAQTIDVTDNDFKVPCCDRDGVGFSYNDPRFLTRVVALRSTLTGQDPNAIFIWLVPASEKMAPVSSVGFGQGPFRDVIADLGNEVHEVGHILGRPNHTNCSGTELQPDQAYPYSGGRIGGPTGATDTFYGFDLGDPSNGAFPNLVQNTVGDVMSYCRPRWPSDYSLRKFLTQIQTRTFPLDPTGDFLAVSATIDPNAGVARGFRATRLAQVGEVPMRVPGAYEIRQHGAGGALLASDAFTPLGTSSHLSDDLLVNEVIDFAPGARRVALWSQSFGGELGSIAISPNSPTVTLTAPTSGSSLPASGPVSVSWTAADVDGDAISATILASGDGGATWRPLVTGSKGTSATIDAADLTGTHGAPDARLRVLVSDGVLTGFADSGPLTVAGAPPEARIISLRSGMVFASGQTVPLEGSVTDRDERTIDPTSIAWSSNLDGTLGTGLLAHAGPLSPGTHLITLTVTDSDRQRSSAAVSIIVEQKVALGSPPVADAGADQSAVEGSTVTLDATGSTDRDGDALVFSWSIVEAPAGVETPQLEGTPANPKLVVPDEGRYVAQLMVSDGRNSPVTDEVAITVTNDPPVVTITAPVNGQLFPVGPVTVAASFTDRGLLDTHTCTVTWDVDQATPPVAATVSELARSCTTTRTLSAGVYTIRVAVSDGTDTGAATVQIVVYDPTAGYVAGGGWIDSPPGAYVADPALSGEGSFGFVSKYKKGATAPTGETEFKFQAGTFTFHSDAYQWLVVAGCKSQYKGTGTVNGVTGYGFLLTAIDGNSCSSKTTDKFRIKAWLLSTSAVVYDNRMGSPDDIDSASPMEIAGGQIVIHK